MPQSTQKRIDELSKVTNLKNALEIMVDLQNNYVLTEEKVPVKFSQQTGKPVEYEWKPDKKFKEDFVFGGEDYAGDITVRLTQDVQKEIMKGPVILDANNAKYIAKFEKRDHSGTDHDGYHHCIAYAVNLNKARVL